MLEHYVGNVKRGDNLDIDSFARRTAGFTMAHLEDTVGQALQRAAIEGAESVTMEHFEFSIDKVLMGKLYRSLNRTTDNNPSVDAVLHLRYYIKLQTGKEN